MKTTHVLLSLCSAFSLSSCIFVIGTDLGKESEKTEEKSDSGKTKK
jgi:hypothetical protein